MMAVSNINRNEGKELETEDVLDQEREPNWKRDTEVS